MNKHSLFINICCFVFLAISSCKKEDTSFDEHTYKSIITSFFINLPANTLSGATTYALTDSDEDKAATIDILAFYKKNNSYFYGYQRQANNVISQSNQISFKVDLLQLQETQLFAVIINGRNELAKANLQPDAPIDAIINTLIVSSPSEWEAHNNNSVLMNNIPMYGYSPETQITTKQIPINIEVNRMLARIDVQNNTTSNKFVLKSACIFNRKTAGFIGYIPHSGQPIPARVPSTANTIKNYSLEYLPSNLSQNIEHAIYTFEAEKPVDKKAATAIVVGGYYQGATQTSYYRIDIPEYDKSGNPIPSTMGAIQRNHLYHIDITDVQHAGAATQEEAFNGLVSITAMIQDWTLVPQDVMIDGQHTLSVSESLVLFPKNGGSKNVGIKTDAQSFGIEVNPNASSWLSTSTSSTGQIAISATPNTGSPRTSFIKIYSNNMNYLLKIEQE